MTQPLDQTKTPYLDALAHYREAGYTMFHTPGHKQGKAGPQELLDKLGAELLFTDVASPGGIEDTRESTGLIPAAEALAAEAWGAERCFFLVNGSSAGVQGLVLTLAGDGQTLIVPRNSHKSLLGGLIFSGAMPHYIEPPVDVEWGVPRNLTLDSVREALAACPQAKALFVTSPTYNGFGAGLEAIGAEVHRAGMPFVVDQAWGPHFRFCSRLPIDAMSAGADAAVTSTHKLISGVTQSSVLMANGERINLGRLNGALRMTQSTSPQAMIYASIDGARMQMATQGEALWSRAVELAEWARERIREIPGVRCLGWECLEHDGIASFDPTRLTVSGCDLGHSGWELETILRDDYRIAVEAADALNVILNVTHGDRKEDVEHLVSALRDYSARHESGDTASVAACRALIALMPPFTRQVMTPHGAFFSASDALPVRDCVGRVSAEIVTPYPPGIPVLGPGELISAELVRYLEAAADAHLHVHGPEDLDLRTLRVVVE
jgi:arginine decarboxylase